MANQILTPTTTTCPFPSNLNPLSPNGYRFNISKIPEFSYFCQQVEIPTLSLPSVQQATPLSINIMAGDILEYSELTLQFLIDENMDNYKALWNWMIGLGFPENYEQYSGYRDQSAFSSLSELKKNFSDGFLQILGNTNAVIQTIEFADMYPTSLQSLTFQSTNSDVQYLVGSATFKYDLFKFV
jgi:hypothetical protein